MRTTELEESRQYSSIAPVGGKDRTMFHEWLWEDEISAKYASTRTESLMQYLQTAAFAAQEQNGNIYVA